MFADYRSCWFWNKTFSQPSLKNIFHKKILECYYSLCPNNILAHYICLTSSTLTYLCSQDPCSGNYPISYSGKHLSRCQIWGTHFDLTEVTTRKRNQRNVRMCWTLDAYCALLWIWTSACCKNNGPQFHSSN